MAHLTEISPDQMYISPYKIPDLRHLPHSSKMPHISTTFPPSINFHSYKVQYIDLFRYNTYKSPINTQLSYPDEYFTNESAAIQSYV